MSKQTRYDSMFDAILTQGLREVMAEDYAALDLKVKASHTELPSKPRHLRLERQTYDEIDRALRRAKPFVPKPIKRVGISILTVAAVGFTTMLCMPAVRAAAIDTIVETYDKYVAVYFCGEQREGVRIDNFTVGYLPEGYYLVSKTELGSILNCVFANNQNDQFVLQLYYNDLSSLQYDSEYMSTRIMYINSMKVQLYEYTNKISAVWKQNDIGFTLTGKLTEMEINKIISNISYNNIH